jgi:tetrapyrrole methylase family protein/MazG family protein
MVKDLPGHLKIQSFDEVYDAAAQFEDVYKEIVRRVMELGQRAEGVTYAVPGSPFMAEATCPEIMKQAQAKGIPVQVIEGISFIEPVCSALGIDPYPRLVLVDAMELAVARFPSFPPSFPVIAAQLYSRQLAGELKMTLCAVYPEDYPVVLVHAAGTKEEVVERMPLYEIDRSEQIGLLSVCYLPPMAEGSAFEDFAEVVARLRDPQGGCPWDKEQTHLSLRKSLLEETYEALQAIDEGDPRKLGEELGDLMLQIVLHAQIGYEEGDFSMRDVLEGIHTKIVHRHPHVFGETQLRDMDHLLSNWEKLKAEERKKKGDGEKGLLDGVPAILPALEQAQELQARAARVGFDWKDVSGVLAKVMEELNEIQAAQNQAELEDELGDLFFALVNYARWRGVESEFALRGTVAKFRERFGFIEQKARAQGREVSQMSFEELDAAWEEAKRK